MVAEVGTLMSKIDQLTADFDKQRQPTVPESAPKEDMDDLVAAALAEAERKIEDAAAAKQEAVTAAARAKTCVLVAGGDGGASPVCVALQARLKELGWTVTMLKVDLSSSGATVSSIAAERDLFESTPVLIVLPEPSTKVGGFFKGPSEGIAPVDAGALGAVLSAMPKLAHVLLLSSVGVDRAGKFPYSLTNAMGALDRRRASDQVLALASSTRGFDFTIVRVASIVADDARPDMTGVSLEVGDSLDDDITVDSAIQALAESLTQPTSRNATFSLSSSPPARGLSTVDWPDLFLKLDGPELLRKPVPRAVATVEAAEVWIEDWATIWVKPGTGLTTPVVIKKTKAGGCGLYFSPKQSNYVSAAEEKERESERNKAPYGKQGGGSDREGGDDQGMKVTRAGVEGGIEICVDKNPGTGEVRIRAKRMAYKPGAPVKVMSEGLILRRLEEDIARWVK